MSRIVSFRQMQDGTREDYLLLDESERDYAAGLAERVLDALRHLDHSLEGYPVSRLRHSLQAATRAQRDGADEELIVAALLHDVGDELAPYNHAELAAAILRPYVRPEVTWIVAQHGLFQNYYYVHHFGGDRQRARPPARSPLVRGHRALLRRLGPVLVRSGLPQRATRGLRAAGAAASSPDRRTIRATRACRPPEAPPRARPGQAATARAAPQARFPATARS